MLEIKNLSVFLSGKEILKNISLSARMGEISVIIGLNGSGKSTLLSAIMREIKYKGDIFLKGKSSDLYSRRELAKNISYMPQILPSPDISLEALVSFGRTAYLPFSGILSSEDKAKVKTAIEECGLSHLSGRLVSSLSGGERQRAFFAMLLASGADIVITDEPTSFTDSPTKKQLLEFLLSLKQRGKTVITVLHNISDAIEIADKIFLIDKGSLLFSGSGAEFALSEFSEEIFSLSCISVDIKEKKKTVFI